MTNASPTSYLQFALSAVQRAIWRAQGGRIVPASATARLSGQLDRDRLLASVADVCGQHDALRTACVLLPSGVPVLEYREHDGSPTEGDSFAVQLREQQDETHELTVSAPSICVDASSLVELLRQIRSRYQGGDLQTDPVSSVQFGEWHRAYVLSAEIVAASARWRDLADDHSLPRPWRASLADAFSPQSIPLGVSAGAVDAARARAGDALSAIDVLLALWRGFWARLGALDHFPIDIELGLRSEPELAHAIGPFTVPGYLAIHVMPDDTCASLARRVRDERMALEAAVDGCPRLQDASSAGGGVRLKADTTSAVAPVGFVCRADVDVDVVDGVRFEIGAAASWLGRNVYRLAVHAASPDVVKLALEFDAGQATVGQAERLAGCWTQFIESWRTHQDAPLRTLEVRPADEIASGRVYLERPPVAAASSTTLERCLRSGLCDAADGVAIASGDRQLRYTELCELVQRIRERLEDEPGSAAVAPIAVLSDRRAETVAAMIGAIYAGRPYIPVNADQPPDRMATLLREAGVRLVIGDRERLAAVPDGEWKVVSFDDVLAAPPRGVDAAPAPVPADALAYMIHTSGSTGTPKAVGVSRRALVHSTLARARYYGEPVRAFLLVSPLHFDSSIAGLYWTLFQGGTLVFPPDDAAADADVLLEAIRQGDVSHLLAVPSLYAALLDRAPEEMARLQVVIVAGEACPPALVERHLRCLPHVSLYNEYGPTEAAVWSTVERCVAAESPVPIGEPIPGARLHILDDNMAPVPPGAEGELYIAGEGVAFGYWNRPQLTAARFLPDIESSTPGGRMYRTGDRVCLRDDGRLEFIGRTDRQVKIRGHRIEPAEIEGALLRHPQVREACVAPVRRDAHVVLAAYVACEPGASAEAVRAWLAGTLPAAMIPTTLHVLARLPRNANGKVDTRALAAEAERPVPAASAAAPETALERLLLELWRGVLANPSLGTSDDFFAAGGDSIRGILLINRLKDRFGADVKAVALTTAPSVARMAAHLQHTYPSAVRAALAERATPARIASLAREPGMGYPLSFAQQRVWLAHHLDPEGNAYNLGAAYRIRGSLDTELFCAAVQILIDRHESFRTRFRLRPEGPVQEIVSSVRADIEVVDASAVDAALIQQMVQERLRQPFSLTEVPLFTATILRRGPVEHVLVLRMHHLIADAWSLAICAREIAVAYDAVTTGSTPTLPRLTVQPLDVAVWQRERHRQGALHDDLHYWLGVLTPSSPELRFPTVGEARQRRTSAGATLHVDVPEDLTKAVSELCAGAEVTSFSAWLAALGAIVHTVAGADDVAIGVNTTGRDRQEIEPLVGFFLNQLVIRLQVADAPTFGELLRHVHAVVSDALSHQELPYEVLTSAWQSRDEQHPLPAIQVKLDYQEFPPIDLRTSTWSAEEIPLPIATTHFDWVVQITRLTAGSRVTAYYSTELFTRDAIHTWTAACVRLLHLATEDPGRRVDDLARASLDDVRPAPRRGLRQRQADALRRVKAERSVAAIEALVHVATGPSLPLVITPRVSSLDLASWVQANRERVAQLLDGSGAILFRGFAQGGPEWVQEVALAAGGPLVEYRYASTPRTRLTGQVYTSTEYPADRTIQLHNEVSYAWNWPQRVFFHCERPATDGGETPLADSRRVWHRIPAEIRDRFAPGVRYARTFGHGVDIDWRDAFHTDDPVRVSDICAELMLQHRWDGDLLHTEGICPSALRHPRTGDWVWFNQAHVFHHSALSAEAQRALLATYGVERLPRHATLADGTPIDRRDLETIRAAFDAETVTFAWQAGDVLMVDNVLVAHGRRPFGGTRKVVVAMTQPDSWSAYSPVGSGA